MNQNSNDSAAGHDGMGAVKAVELALRAHEEIPEEGKRQIIDFVKQMEDTYFRQDSGT